MATGSLVKIIFLSDPLQGRGHRLGVMLKLRRRSADSAAHNRAANKTVAASSAKKRGGFIAFIDPLRCGRRGMDAA